MGFIVGDIQDPMIEGKRLLDNPSNRCRDMYPMLLELTIEKGTCFTAVFSAIRVIKDSKCAISLSLMSILEQPERMRVLKDFNSYISLGRLLRLVQSFKFSSIRLLSDPIDRCTLRNLEQCFKMSCSRLGNPEKSGVSFKHLE